MFQPGFSCVRSAQASGANNNANIATSAVACKIDLPAQQILTTFGFFMISLLCFMLPEKNILANFFPIQNRLSGPDQYVAHLFALIGYFCSARILLCRFLPLNQFLALLDIGVAHGRVRVDGCLFNDLMVAQIEGDKVDRFVRVESYAFEADPL
jgi:hypothetical protein